MTRGSIIWGKDELTRAPAPDAKHNRRDFNSASKREGFHTSTHPFASVSAMVTRRRKTSQSFPHRPFLVQFAIDVLAVLFAFLFVAVTGIGFAFALFWFLFV